jgi:hypothetical protein
LNDKGQEQASAWIAEKWQPLLEAMPESSEKQRFGQALQDGVVTPEEVLEVRTSAGAVLDRFDELTKPSDYTLGDTRFSGATNKPIATASTPTSRQKELQALVKRGAITQAEADLLMLEANLETDDEKESAKEAEIRQYMEILGLTREQATKLAYDAAKIETDPAGGVVRFIDIAKQLKGEDGAVTELPISGTDEGLTEPNIPQSETLYEKAEEATGPIQSFQAGLSYALGAVGGPIDERTIAARQYFAAAENTVIRAFSLNPRYPVAEQNRIKENISISPRVLDSAPLMRARMSAIDNFLKNEQEALEFAISQPGIGRTQKNNDKQTINSIKRFREVLGVPEGESKIKIISRTPAS